MAEEVFRVRIPVDVEDNTAEGLRRPRQTVTAFQREMQRHQREAQRHARLGQAAQRQELQRQRMTLQFHRSQTQLERDQFRRMTARVQFQRQEVMLSRQQLAYQQQQDQAARRAQASQRPGLLSRVGGALAGGAGGLLKGVGGLAKSALGGVVGAATSLPGLLGIAGGVAGGIAFPLQLASDMEQATIAFTRFLGSADKARAMLAELQDLAAETPLEFPQLRDTAKQLLAFGFAADKILPMLRDLADVDAAGVPMEQVARALGQISVKGRVQGDELLQLQEAGINATKYIAEGWGISTEAALDYVQKGAVPARRAIRHILEGIRRDFGGLSKAQSASLGGLWSTIRDTAKTKLALPWGEGLAAGIKPGFQQAVAWLDSTGGKEMVERIGKSLQGLGTRVSAWFMGGVSGGLTKLETFLNSKEFKEAQSPTEVLSVAWSAVTESLRKSWVAELQKGIEGQGAETRKAQVEQMGLLEAGWNLVWKNISTWGTSKWNDFLKMMSDFTRDALVEFGTLGNRVEDALRDIFPWIPKRKGPNTGKGAQATGTNLPGDFTPPSAGAAYGMTVAPGAVGAAASPAAEAAITRGMHYLGSREFINLCLKYIDDMYGATGARYGSAWQAAQALATNRGGSLADVPRGQLAFMRADASNDNSGHVMLSLGGGQFLDPSAQGVRITGPGDPLYRYYESLYYGYGAHGTPAVASGAPSLPTAASVSLAARPQAPVSNTVAPIVPIGQPLPSSVTVPVTVNVNGTGVGAAEVRAIVEEETADYEVRLARRLADADQNMPIAR